jgi:hypothetical protein
MLKRNFGILILTICFILITIPSVLGASMVHHPSKINPNTLEDGNFVEVAPTGGNNDQNQINSEFLK